MQLNIPNGVLPFDLSRWVSPSAPGPRVSALKQCDQCGGWFGWTCDACLNNGNGRAAVGQ